MQRFSSVGLSMIVLGGAALAACSSSSSSPPGTCQAYAVPTGTVLTNPTVSFKNDVVPIFQGSCALSASCHGGPAGGSNNGVYLGGPKSAVVDPQTIFAAIVNKASPELTSMNFVTSGDATQSYLMHKMDGDNCLYQSQCAAMPVPNCGVSMPQGSGTLPVATRDTVRRWIAQGALNN